MMYRCDSCHADFDEPTIRFERENLDGENGIFYAQYAVCPYCGAEEMHLEELEETEDGNEDTD